MSKKSSIATKKPRMGVLRMARVNWKINIKKLEKHVAIMNTPCYNA